MGRLATATTDLEGLYAFHTDRAKTEALKAQLDKGDFGHSE